MEELNIVRVRLSPLLTMICFDLSGVYRAAAIVVVMFMSFFGSTGELRAVVVDSEVLLLVDVIL